LKMPTRILEIWIEEECPHCGGNFLIAAIGEDQYGNKKAHTKCRYCGISAFEKIGANEFTHLEGMILERVIEYLQLVSPLKYTKGKVDDFKKGS
jgi:hypothetical protein